MRYELLSWIAFTMPSRLWMALPIRVREWWAAEWLLRYHQSKLESK